MKMRNKHSAMFRAALRNMPLSVDGATANGKKED